MGWAFNREASAPEWEPASNEEFVEIVMRGATRFIPGLRQYLASIPTPIVHYSGYYTRTPENLPLIGPLGVENAFIVSALAGYGTMAACAAGDLCARWVLDKPLPKFAHALSSARYDNQELMAELAAFFSRGIF